MKINVFFLFAFVVLGSFGAPALKSDSKENSTLQAVTKRYRTSQVITMDVEKKLKSELLGRETSYNGKISLSKGLFRFETSSPEKSLLVFDGEYLWSEQAAPAEFPGPAQVAKAKLEKKNRSQILVATLLSGGKILENFNLNSETKNENGVLVSVTPKDLSAGLSLVEIQIDTKKNLVLGISYSDDVGNRTELKFSNVEFKKLSKKNSGLFKYTPPKGAQVSNI